MTRRNKPRHPCLRLIHRLRVKTIDRTKQIQSRLGFSPVTPIFVITCNRTTALRNTLESFRNALCSNYEVVIHDNSSTYPPMLDLLMKYEDLRIRVYRSCEGAHTPSQLNNVSATVDDWYSRNRHRRLSDVFVVTDPDISLDQPPAVARRRHCDAIQLGSYLLRKMPSVEVVGPMLRIDDIPDYYPLKQAVLDIHTRRFWSKTPQSITWRGIATAYQHAPIDTTFGVYRRGYAFKRLSKGLRTYAPFTAQHLDWYLDPNALTEDQVYYAGHASEVSNWSGTRFFPATQRQ